MVGPRDPALSTGVRSISAALELGTSPLVTISASEDRFSGSTPVSGTPGGSPLRISRRSSGLARKAWTRMASRASLDESPRRAQHPVRGAGPPPDGRRSAALSRDGARSDRQQADHG